jgi:hypothetical protein
MSSTRERRPGKAAADQERAHLERLGIAMQRRGWRVQLTRHGADPALKVTNPTVPEMHELILCRRADDGFHFMWPWKEAIEPVDKLDAAARRIRHVLRGSEDPGDGHAG